ncbi:MAG: HAMP domain-containing sensor histidine kinase [Pseudomonadota bacterium]
MIGRWSLLVRLGAIVAVALFAIQLVIVGLIFVQRSQDTGAGFRYPLPDQAAAMVQLLESEPDRQLLLRAFNSPDLTVSLEGGEIEAYTAETLRLPRVERALGRYSRALGERRYAAFIALPEGEEATLRFNDRGLWTRWPLRMAIELSTGEILVVETRGDLAARVFSWPLGFFSGLVSLLVAIIVLLAVRRETKPLRALAEAAQRFAHGATRQQVAVTGSPEVRNLLRAFNDMQDRIADLLESRTLMLGALGHDIRTYVTRLRLRVDGMQDTEMRAAAERDLQQLSSLVDDGVALAKLGIEGAGDQVIDLAALLAEVVADYKVDGAAIHFKQRGRGGARVRGLPGNLRRLFGNLIDNALKYGEVCWIALVEENGEIVVEIEDDGPGVSPDQLEHIKRPFFRSDEARTLKADGHGLGLAIANEIAVSLGGRLQLVSDPGNGLLCRVSLPRADD